MGPRFGPRVGNLQTALSSRDGLSAEAARLRPAERPTVLGVATTKSRRLRMADPGMKVRWSCQNLWNFLSDLLAPGPYILRLAAYLQQ